MRIEQLQQKMVDHRTDLVILSPGSNMSWVFGFSPYPDERACLALIGPKEVAMVVPALNANDMRTQTDVDFYEWTDAQGPQKAFADAVARISPLAHRVAMDETMRADHVLMILDHLPAAKADIAADILGPLRVIKSQTEIDKLRENAKIADQVQQTVWAALDSAKTEQDMYRVAQDTFETFGAKIAFGIIGGGAHSGFPHHHTGPSELPINQPIVIDVGAQKDGYYSDITRMAAIGPVSDDYHEIHAIVERAVCAALAVVKPGVRASQVDSAARGIISQSGYGSYFTHRTGHGVGMDIHETPFITQTNDMVLEKGMVFTIEPGIYLPDRFGIRLEEVVVVTDTGCEILSQLPRDLHVV